jgi:hypothetical protein
MNTPRPNGRTPEVIEATAAGLAVLILDNNPDAFNGTTPEMISDIREAMRYGDTDGYELAKDLEERRWGAWEVDASLVATLDRAYGVQMRHIDDAVEAWLPTSGLVAPEVGATVRLKVSITHPVGQGVIKSVDYRRGKATIDRYIENWEDLV